MMAKNPLQTIEERAAKKNPKPKEGTILNVTPTLAYVQRVGSTATYPCEYDAGQGVATGKRCTIQWVAGRKHYVVGTVYGQSKIINAEDQGLFELAPPSNLRALDGLAGSLLAAWDVPAQLDCLFEVELSGVTVTGVTSVMKTRGGEFVYPYDTPVYLHVRSVNKTFQSSSWSNWLLVTPGIGGGGGYAEPVCFDGEILFLYGDVLMMGVL